jgi:hypothetical protein
MDIRGLDRASNAPCCLDLLRGHLRLSIGLLFGLDTPLILALLVVVATIFLWPLAAVAVLDVIYRVFGVHPELLIYITAFVGIIVILMIWWWHVANNKT